MDDIERITSITSRFRKNLDPCWVGVKALLAERGIETEHVILADTFPEDHHMIYVALVTPQRQVFEFYYEWRNTEEWKGRITEWKDLTTIPEAAYMHESVALALSLAGKV